MSDTLVRRIFHPRNRMARMMASVFAALAMCTTLIVGSPQPAEAASIPVWVASTKKPTKPVYRYSQLLSSTTTSCWGRCPRMHTNIEMQALYYRGGDINRPFWVRIVGCTTHESSRSAKIACPSALFTQTVRAKAWMDVLEKSGKVVYSRRATYSDEAVIPGADYTI